MKFGFTESKPAVKGFIEKVNTILNSIYFIAAVYGFYQLYLRGTELAEVLDLIAKK